MAKGNGNNSNRRDRKRNRYKANLQNRISALQKLDDHGNATPRQVVQLKKALRLLAGSK